MKEHAKLSTNLRLAGALLDGATVEAHLCSDYPANAKAVPTVSLGTGNFNASGGEFEVKRAGRATCIAVVWEGEVAITKPSKLPLRVGPGQRAKVGPLEFTSAKQ